MASHAASTFNERNLLLKTYLIEQKATQVLAPLQEDLEAGAAHPGAVTHVQHLNPYKELYINNNICRNCHHFSPEAGCSWN